MRDCHEHGRRRARHDQPERRPVQPEVQPLDVADREALADEHRVAILGPSGPRSVGFVPPLPGRPDEPILLERVDDLLQPEHVRLERRHVGEQQRETLLPAVGEVPDVQRRDAERFHPESVRERSAAGQTATEPAGGATGNVTVNVEPRPSSESTRIRPPCCSTTCRAIANPSPVPPPRTRTRSTL